MLYIIIVCTGNTCRSPMAEMLLRSKIKENHLEQRILVSSAGIAVWNEGDASTGAQEAMKLRGFDVKSHRSHQLLPSDIMAADLLLTMTVSHKAAVLDIVPEAQSKVYTLGEFAGTNRDVFDPYGGNSAIYEDCAGDIEKMMEMSWGKIVELAGKRN
jgi:protein-tyrosine-phosphatase